MKKLMILISVVSLGSFIAACGGAANTNVSNANTNANAGKSNAATPAPSATPAPTAANNTNANAAPKAQAKGDEGEVDGELQVGKTESVILYVGEESGDYAAYCFANDSDAGKAILAACKDKQQCVVKGTIDGTAKCKVPGLEADLSDSGRITSVNSVKSLGKKK